MDNWLIGISWLPILLWTVRQYLIFSDDIDDIKAETLDSNGFIGVPRDLGAEGGLGRGARRRGRNVE